jgi:hypothetical protein
MPARVRTRSRRGPWGCWRRGAAWFAWALCFGIVGLRPAWAQNPPIAIVPVEGVELSGGLNVAQGKAVIVNSGSVTAGDHTAVITLPRRGNLRLCATTTVHLTSDSTIDGAQPDSQAASQAGGQAANPSNSPATGQAASQPGTAVPREAPGLMMALGRGALEANFSTGHNSDVILTPDFRILISGPGTAQVQIRLGVKGDTCVDNRGSNAPYVTVSSIFDGGAYRVQPNQRVMFQHGSLREVVDNEKESCGCPVEPVKSVTGNEFPVAQSEGLAPLSTPPPNAAAPGVQAAQATAQLGYDGSHPAPPTATAVVPPVVTPLATTPVDRPPKHSALARIGRFFKKLFGG